MKKNKVFKIFIFVLVLCFSFSNFKKVSAEVSGGEGLCFVIIGDYFYIGYLEDFEGVVGAGVFPTTCPGVDEGSGGGYTPPEPIPPRPDPVPPGPFSAWSVQGCYGGPDGYGNGYIDLQWTPSDGATSYQVKARPWSGGNWYHIGDPTGTSFTAIMPAGTDWFFQVVAVKYSEDGGSTIADPGVFFGGNCPFPPDPSVSVSINSPTVRNDGTHYTVTSVSTGSWSGATTLQGILIGGFNGGDSTLARGDIYWFPSLSSLNSIWGSAYEDRVSCGGGEAAVYNGGWGNQYVNLHSCTTSLSGNNRTTTYEVSFNNNFTSPVSGNDIDGYYATDVAATNGWQNFPDLFNLDLMPSVTNVTISSSSIVPDGSTQYTISVVGSDAAGGTAITDQLALINYDQNINGSGGHDSSQYRGYPIWYSGDLSWGGGEGALKNIKTCNSGKAGIYSNAYPYGADYINLISCSTSVSGNTRTSNFVVSFNNNFTTPTSNNDISGYVRSGSNSMVSGWMFFNTNFTIAGMSGSFSFPNGSTCYMGDGESSCGVNVSWSTTNPYGTSQITTDTGGGASGNSGTNVVFNVPAGAPPKTRTLTLSNNGQTLDVDTISSACAGGTAWDVPSGTCKTIVTAATVTIQGTVIGGRITSNPNGISCAGTCTAPFSLNSTVTLTATPSSSYWRFSQWGPLGDCSGTNPSCTLTVNGDKNVYAIFVPRSFNYKEF